MRVACLLVLFFAFKGSLLAQPFNLEWIQWGQSYAKIPVTQAGLYAVNVQTIENAGLPLQGKASSGLVLYNLGKAIPLQIWDGGDGVLDLNDQIGFWGEPNRGQLDSLLYPTGQQTSPGFSLFQDTAFYYLSWLSSGSFPRVNQQMSSPTGSLSPEPWYLNKQLLHYPESYFDGQIILEYGAFSEYTDGEGWAGNRFNRTQNQTRTLSTPGYVNTGPQTVYHIRMLGKSDAVSALPEINHHLRVEVSADAGPFNIIHDTLYKGYMTVDLKGALPAGQIGNSNTRFRFTGVNDIGAVADFQSTAWIELTYPRNFNLGNNSNAQVWLQNSSNSRLLRFTAYPAAGAAPLLINPNSGDQLQPIRNADTLWFVVPADWNGYCYLRDSSSTQPFSVQKVFTPQLSLPSFSGAFLIISHPALQNGAIAYQNYRQSKGFNTHIVYTPDLFDLFSFGIHHPLAIRNYCRYLVVQNLCPAYMLLLGKGQSPERIRFNASNFQADLVPTMGFPPSDLLFTSGISGPDLVPTIPTGRVPASNEQEILQYLAKLQTYENESPALYRKKIVHLGGGRNQSENDYYRNALGALEQMAADTLLGAQITNFYKDDAVPVNTTLKTPIHERINAGIGFMNYFGHGAADILEIDIGSAQELNNSGRYPIMYFSGCILGNSYTDNSLGEDFLFSSNKGAVGWVGTSSYGFNHVLDIYAKSFYQFAFQQTYGSPVSQLQKNVTNTFTDSTDVYARMLCRQMLLEGDPALKLYAPEQPDWQFADPALHIPANANADADSLLFELELENPGKTSPDSLSILVNRTLTNGKTLTPALFSVKPPLFNKRIRLTLPNPSNGAAGINTLQISLDPDKTIPELNEFNNELNYPFYLPGKGAGILFPTDKSIISDRNLTLKAGLLTPRRGSYDYAMELDTTPLFNSSLLQQTLLTGQSYLVNWNVQLPNIDSTTWYFRVRLEDPNQPAAWNLASFTYYKDSRQGWTYHRFSQTLDGHFAYLDPDTLTEQVDFSRVTSVIHAAFTSGSAGAQAGRLFRINYFATRIGAILDGISVLAIHPDDVTRYSYPSTFNQSANYPGVYGPPQYTYSGVFFFNTTTAAHRDSLRDHLLKIPQGYHVLIHNGRFTGITSWDTSLFNAFEKVGGNKIRFLKEGHPYILSGKKGLSAGQAVELLADTLSPIPATQQVLSFATVYYPKGTRGNWESEAIGPARNWEAAHWKRGAADHPRDSFLVEILGQDANTNWTLLGSTLSGDSLDLRTINAKQYPYLKIRLKLSDDSLRTPVQWEDLSIYYEQAPDITVDPELSELMPDSALAGRPLSMRVVFRNISPVMMDSFQVRWGIINASGGISTLKDLPPIAPGDTAGFSLQMMTSGWQGTNNAFAEANPQPGIAELYRFNNYYQQNTFYNTDQRNPLLDITFDGRHIQNGEIIRPDPLILLTLRDDDPYHLLEDTNRIKLWIKTPGSSQFSRIGYQDPRISFEPAQQGNNQASISFSPVFEQDGVYELKASAQDASGVPAGNQDMVCSFEINRHPAITHVLPYPNPFTTQCRFVFTLTGTRVPDELKIQIMTLNGKVVKEIQKEELGPLRIGNNITSYTWDGRDAFGDVLANGVYLYRVVARIQGTGLDHRSTNADRYFKHDLGKLYILR